MENENLIEFTSPSNSPKYHQYGLIRTSPSLISSNPFDEPPIKFAYPTQQFVSPSKINFEDFQCDFLCRETLGRESLLLQSNDYGRESLGIIDLDDLDIGRPSLGIERLKIMKKSINTSNDILNEALLYSSEDINDTVFNTTNPSFNSNSLGSSLFSSISSIKVADLTTTNILNKRLYNSGDFFDRLKFNKFNHLNRVSSLPEALPIKEDDEELLTNKLWSSAITTTTNEDLDPILIEARQLADHIEDGSIFNEALDNIYTVEFTTPPNLVDNSFENFDEIPQKSEETTNDSNQHNSNSLTKDPRELLHSLSEILNTNNQNSEGQLLLNSLANILLSKSNSPPSDDNNNGDNSDNSNNHQDDSGNSSIENQKATKQQLNECYEVLDLRLKTSQDDSKSSSSDDLPLDLSIKSKEHEFVQPKIVLSRSSDKQQNSKQNHSNRSLSQNDNSNLSKLSFTTNNASIGSSNNSSLKIKKNEEKRKTGPLKAVIPIDNMMRTPVLYSATTPTTENKLKKTSTPINEPKMRPVAQSTPDTHNKWKFSPLQTSDQQNECKNHLNNTDTNLSSDHSKSMNNKSLDNRRLRYSLNEDDQQKQQTKSFLQRRSLTDLKRPQISKSEHTLTRSYSAGKDPKILSSIKRVRQSINRSDKSKGLYRSCSSEEKESQIKVNLKRDQVLNENKTRVGNGVKSMVIVRKNSGKENFNR